VPNLSRSGVLQTLLRRSYARTLLDAVITHDAKLGAQILNSRQELRLFRTNGRRLGALHERLDRFDDCVFVV
jgi:hypothetical protein